MSTLALTQFAHTTGKIGGTVQGRNDVQQLQSGLVELINSLPIEQGPVVHRTGTDFIGEVKYSDRITRIEEFVFSIDQALIIEIGDYYLRFWLDGAAVLIGDTLWGTGIDYLPGIVILTGPDNYRCIVEHTSGVFATDLAAGYWELINDQVVDSFAPYEIPTPYGQATVNALSIAGSADVVYIAFGANTPHKLSRYANDDWRLEKMVFNDGPFNPTNTDYSVSVTIAGVSGATTITATSDIFKESDDGKLFRIQIPGTALVDGQVAVLRLGAYTSGTVMAATLLDLVSADFQTAQPAWRFGAFDGQVVVGAGQIYDVVATEQTEVNQRYTRGQNLFNTVAWLAPDAIPFDAGSYWVLTAGHAIVKTYNKVSNQTLFTIYEGHHPSPPDNKYTTGWIAGAIALPPLTGWTDSGTGTAVLTEVPISVADTGDWPAICGLYQERLIFGATQAQPQTLWFSQTAGYENFAPSNEKNEVLDDSAFTYSLAGGRTIDKIQWIVGADKLVIGTFGAEFFLRRNTTDNTLTPSNVAFDRRSNHGSAPNQAPHIVGSDLVYVQRLGNIVRGMAYDVANDSYVSKDLTKLFPEVLSSAGGFAGSAYRQEPSSVIYYYTNEGRLLTLTLELQDQVIAWADQDVGGAVVSAAVIPSTNNQYDTYFIVKRTIDGGIKQYIERISQHYADSFYWNYLDCSLAYHSTQSIETATGLDHLEGEIITIFADGKHIGAGVVVGGEVDLGGPYNHVLIGYPYSTTVQLLPIEQQLSAGSTVGKEKRTTRLSLQILNTMDVKVGTELTKLFPVNIGLATWPQTGVFGIDIEEDFALLAGDLYIRHDEPTPCTIMTTTREVEFRD